MKREGEGERRRKSEGMKKERENVMLCLAEKSILEGNFTGLGERSN